MVLIKEDVYESLDPKSSAVWTRKDELARPSIALIVLKTVSYHIKGIVLELSFNSNMI